MRKIISGIFSLSLLAGAGAQAMTHQINASSTGGFVDLGIGDYSVMSFGLDLTYRLGISDMLQIEVPVSFGYIAEIEGVSDSLTSYGVGIGPVFNFAGDIRNSVFASAVFNMNKTGDLDAVNSVIASVGKRFELVSNVSYEPAVVFSYGLGDAFEGDRMDVNIKFLSLTATF